MKISLHPTNPTLAIANLDAGEILTATAAARARQRAKRPGAKRVEVWRGDALIKAWAVSR